MLLLGIDVGTTGAKAAVFDADGTQKGYGFEEYGITCPHPGWAEQDAESVWNITKRVIAIATKQAGANINALSLSVQGDAVISINQERQSLAPVQLGMDYRGTDESLSCSEQLGDQHLFQLTGMRPHPLNSLTKILWIKKNDPALYARTWKFVTYADFILGKLGSDEIVIDYTQASRTMAFDLQKSCWSDEILNTFGINVDKLAKPVPSGTVVGRLSSALAAELGIAPGAMIVTGGHDQTCAAFGAGIIHEHMALDSHGTAEVVSTMFDRPHLDQVMYHSYYPCYRYVVPEKYFTFALNHTGGILLKWFVENFCHADAEEARQIGARIYELVIKKASVQPSPVMVLPYFNGSGTPSCDLKAKGAILGLTLSTTRHEIARAIIESLSFEMRLNIETMRSAGLQITELRCVGGGARSPIGLQNKSDVTGLPVYTLKIREAACLGAAMLAGMAVKCYQNAEDAAKIVSLDHFYMPRLEKKNLYDGRYELYSGIYGKIKEILYQL